MSSEYLYGEEYCEEDPDCCQFCPTANDGNFLFDALTCQLICKECYVKLYEIFIWPRYQGSVLTLYPAILRTIMDATGLSYKECRRLFIEKEISLRTKEVEMEFQCYESEFQDVLPVDILVSFLEMVAWLKSQI